MLQRGILYFLFEWQSKIMSCIAFCTWAEGAQKMVRPTLYEGKLDLERTHTRFHLAFRLPPPQYDPRTRTMAALDSGRSLLIVLLRHSMAGTPRSRPRLLRNLRLYSVQRSFGAVEEDNISRKAAPYSSDTCIANLFATLSKLKNENADAAAKS